MEKELEGQLSMPGEEETKAKQKKEKPAPNTTLRTLTKEFMFEYVLEHAPADMETFVNETMVVPANSKSGKKQYNQARAARVFAKKYMPELLPKEKPSSDEFIKKYLEKAKAKVKGTKK